MKKLLWQFILLSCFFYHSLVWADNTFDPATKTLTIDSVTVGDRKYSNVVIRIDQFTVLGVGSSVPVGTTISNTCSSNNLTVDKFNAIQVGMTLEQVIQILGCEVSRVVFRADGFVMYQWSIQGVAKEIDVIFEEANLMVSDQFGSSFKAAVGI